MESCLTDKSSLLSSKLLAKLKSVKALEQKNHLKEKPKCETGRPIIEAMPL